MEEPNQSKAKAFHNPIQTQPKHGFISSHMATETLTPEVDSLLKKDEADSDKEMEVPVSDDKDEEEIEEEKEPVTPVSERPTRARKRTERYILDTPLRSPVTKPLSIEQGRGTQLKEIPNVAYKLSKRKPDDNLFLLHTILYGKKAKVQMLKRNIGQFSGFVWSEQEEEKQKAKAKDKLEKCVKEKLIDFCDVLDIPINKSNVKKEELSVRVLEFLMHPKATREVVLAENEKETKKRKKSSPKNVTPGESSDVPAKRRRQAKKSGKQQDLPSETEDGNDPRGEDDAAPEKENIRNEDTESEDEKDKAVEKKSTDKKSSSKRAKKEKQPSKEEKSHKDSASDGKSSKQADQLVSSSSKKEKVEKDNSSKKNSKKQTSQQQAKGSKDQGTEKASKKGKKEPTNKELHVVVAKILKEVDFNTATLSDILRKLGSHFGLDLMHRKTEVKDIITDAINEMSDDEEST